MATGMVCLTKMTAAFDPGRQLQSCTLPLMVGNSLSERASSSLAAVMNDVSDATACFVTNRIAKWKDARISFGKRLLRDCLRLGFEGTVR
jgi:hypothetical protein